MPKQRVIDSRFDFRGGVNLASNPDLLADNELLDATNTRLQTAYGAMAKRTGTRRMHTTVLGGTVRGLTQWDSPSGKQIVAIANGNLYHKTSELGDFTTVVPSPLFSTTDPALFATFRDKTSGAPLNLYIASGGIVYSWNGSVLTRVDGVNSAPEATAIASYHTRLFATHVDFPKFLYWSKVGLGNDFGVAGPTDGGSSMVDTLSGDEILALDTVGSSLMIATRNTIVRFTGHSSDDIVIAQDTEGISSEVGIVNPLALARAEELVAIISDRGPYLVSEAGVQPIGVKVEPWFDGITLSTARVGYHRGRREIWFADGDEVMVFSLRLQSWYGPFIYPFTITALSRYEDSTGAEWLIAGCSDGFVRHLDTGTVDDLLAAGGGGSIYNMIAELPPIFFPPGPGVVKALDSIALQANTVGSADMDVAYNFDNQTAQFAAVPASAVLHKRIDLSAQGYRLRLRFIDDGTAIVVVYGYVLHGWNYNRN